MFIYLPVSGCVALLVVHGKLNKSSSSLHQELESLVPCCSTYLAVYARQLKHFGTVLHSAQRSYGKGA